MRKDRADVELGRRLDAWVASDTSELRPEVQSSLRGELNASLEPVQPLAPDGVLVLQFLFVFAACAAGFMAALDKAGFHMMTAAQMGGMGALLGGGGVLFAVQLARRMVPGSRVVAPFAWGLLLAGLGAAMAGLFPWRVPRAFASEGWPCAVLELAIAVPAAGMFWMMARRGALFASAGLGGALTALAVFLALTVDQAQCMFPQAPHLLVWHGGMAAVLCGAGALIGRAMERRLR